MLKTRDFYLMKVYHMKGKYLGVIHDIAIDFHKGEVIGFVLSNFSIFNKKNFIPKDKILSIGEELVVSDSEKYKPLCFSDIKHMDIISSKNVMLGVLEDLVIDKGNMEIKGLIISSGIIDKMYKGKSVILPGSCILCEEFILYKGTGEIKLQSLPHNLGV